MIVFNTPAGVMEIRSLAGKILSVSFADGAGSGCKAEKIELECLRQLDEYFKGKRKNFDLPFVLSGSAFELAVWQELQKIPFGETRTYGEIASAIGRPGAARAVGGACKRNKLLLLVPCHRVTGCLKKLTGYIGGVERKRMLLALEKRAATP